MQARSVLALAASAALAPAAFGQFTNFDSYAEGFYGPSSTFDGISVYDVNNVNGFFPDGEAFTPDDVGTEVIIERSTLIYNDFPDWISPFNTLTFGSAFVPGDNLSLGALATATFSTGTLSSAASFNLIYLDEWVWDGIVVHLDALNRGDVVSSQSFTIVGQPKGERDIVDTKLMEISGVEFDAFRIYATLGSDYTTFRALIDDVSFTPVPAPGLAAALVGLPLLARRRRA